jgi:hypothetical protein
MRLRGALVLVVLVLLIAGCSSTAPAAHAPPPSTPVPRVGAMVVDGVTLAPITAGEWRECQQVADATRAPDPCPTLLPVPIPGYCAAVPRHPPLVVHGSVASMYECGEDPGPSVPIADQYIGTVSGHELVEWRQDGVTCEVSFHGHSTVNQDLAVTVAHSTHMVLPSGD